MATKPREVNWAISLFWASLAVGPIKMAVQWTYLRSLGPTLFIALVLIITIAVLSFFVWKTDQGKNWARITFLVLFVFGLPFSLSLLRAEFSRSTVSGILSLLQVIMQGMGLWLLFTTPGRNWFKIVKPDAQLPLPD